MKDLKTFHPQESINVKFTLDKYSKTLLTIISACLLLIVVNIYFSPGKLNALETVQDVNIKSINGSSLWGGELPVNLEKINGSGVNNEIPVNIKSIKGSSLWDSKIPVDIQGVNGSSIYGNSVPVKVN